MSRAQLPSGRKRKEQQETQRAGGSLRSGAFSEENNHDSTMNNQSCHVQIKSQAVLK